MESTLPRTGTLLAAADGAAVGRSSGTVTAAPEPVVTVNQLSKTFGAARVLRDVSIELAAGEVHALVGENGSGKSTLIKCLSGFYIPDQGSEMVVDGGDMTRSMHECPFAFVHQDLGLVPGISILENIALVQGFGGGPLARIRWGSERRRVAALLQSYGVERDPSTPVSALGAAERALVAILRAVENKSRSCRLLVLDEPTAALPEIGRERVLDIVRAVAARGTAVLYVSHRLREVLALADKVTVLRDGVRVGTFAGSELTERDLVQQMVGHELAATKRRVSTARAGQDPALRVQNLCGAGITDLSFSVQAGEIVGLTGLLGAGQNDVGKLVFGAARRTSGQVYVSGRSVRPNEPASAVGAGIAYIPSDRVNESTLSFMSVRENVTLAKLNEFARRGRIRRRAESEYVDRLISEFDVRPTNPELKMRQLSGGNQQKAIIGKWLGSEPKVLIVDEPTQGVDVGARAAIYRLIEQAAEGGMAVIIVDTDLDEVERLADRVLVLADGQLSGEMVGPEITRPRTTELMNSASSAPEGRR